MKTSRTGGWLSGELDPRADRSVGRLVERDVEARRPVCVDVEGAITSARAT